MIKKRETFVAKTIKKRLGAAIKWPFIFLAHLMSVAALLGETKQMQHEIKKEEKHQ